MEHHDRNIWSRPAWRAKSSRKVMGVTRVSVLSVCGRERLTCVCEPVGIQSLLWGEGGSALIAHQRLGGSCGYIWKKDSIVVNANSMWDLAQSRFHLIFFPLRKVLFRCLHSTEKHESDKQKQQAAYIGPSSRQNESSSRILFTTALLSASEQRADCLPERPQKNWVFSLYSRRLPPAARPFYRIAKQTAGGKKKHFKVNTPNPITCTVTTLASSPMRRPCLWQWKRRGRLGLSAALQLHPQTQTLQHAVEPPKSHPPKLQIQPKFWRGIWFGNLQMTLANPVNI